jgi:hypothetical protein
MRPPADSIFRTANDSGVVIIGNDGPYTSESNMPCQQLKLSQSSTVQQCTLTVRAPTLESANARLTATVDLPTPPLHELTATHDPTPAKPAPAAAMAGRAWAVGSTVMPGLPSHNFTPASAAAADKAERQAVVIYKQDKQNIIQLRVT